MYTEFRENPIKGLRDRRGVIRLFETTSIRIYTRRRWKIHYTGTQKRVAMPFRSSIFFPYIILYLFFTIMSSPWHFCTVAEIPNRETYDVPSLTNARWGWTLFALYTYILLHIILYHIWFVKICAWRSTWKINKNVGTRTNGFQKKSRVQF